MPTDTIVVANTTPNTEVHYVDWGAIIAGTVLASAISLVLFAFGTGIGLSMVSPYEGEGASKTAYFVALGLWTLWVILSSFMAGGYLAGRMRRRIGDGSPHEVEVRDSAHGVSVWALGVVVASLLLALGVSGMVGSAAKIAGPAAATAVAKADVNSSTVDALFRGTPESIAMRSAAPPAADPSMSGQPSGATVRSAADVQASHAEVGRLLATAVRGDVSADNKAYVARLVAAETGLSQADAEARVNEVLAEAKRKADAARKAGVVIAFLTAAALLVAAAAAAWAAALGGKHRDEGTDVFWRWSRP